MDPTTDLHVRTRPAGGYTIVAISGELDIANAYALRERLLDVLHRAGIRLVLDLSAVSFCDASGLATLVATRRRAVLLGGALRLAGAQPQVLKILRVTGLHRHLAIYPTTAAACMPPAATPQPEPARAVGQQWREHRPAASSVVGTPSIVCPLITSSSRVSATADACADAG